MEVDGGANEPAYQRGHETWGLQADNYHVSRRMVQLDVAVHDGVEMGKRP